MCQRAQVQFARHDTMGAYTLIAECPRGCGQFQMRPADDPRAASFRDWTVAEIEAIIDAIVNQLQPRCPVDCAEVDVMNSTSFKGPGVTIFCPRCRQNFSRQLASS
jgi:hypothetical protein